MTTSPGLDGSARGLTRPQPIRSTSKHSTKTSISQSGRWISIPKDVQFYLRYHKECLSHHHYAFKYDGGDFLKTTFLEIAMNDDSQALLYAIVAFAAYHHAIAQDDGRISKFLQFYNTSITMLHQTLLKKRHNVSTLLTILQLATIEVRFGTASSFTPVARAPLTGISGISGRLGQPPRSSTSCSSNPDRSFQPRDHYAR